MSEPNEQGAVDILESLNAVPDATSAPDATSDQPDIAEADETTNETTTTAEWRIEGDRFRFGDEEYDSETLKALLESGKNPRQALAEATRRNQEAAEQRRAYEPYLTDLQALYQLPEAERARVVQTFQAVMSGEKASVPTATDAELDPEMLTDNERALYAQIRRLEGRLGQVQSKVGEVDGFVSESRTERKAREAADAINAKYAGANADAATLMRLSKETGIADPRAAWTVANEEAIAAGAFRAGAKAATGAKPRGVPDGQSKVFDPDSLTLDERVNLRMRGFVPQ